MHATTTFLFKIDDFIILLVFPILATSIMYLSSFYLFLIHISIFRGNKRHYLDNFLVIHKFQGGQR
jgi:hypothetical protein